MIFSVIISEKGGAERRESFERTEVNVGRVQGNDLMLPKGNVSKRHARLLYRDGRFIVTDLKSTNGTYVNGRKITQATIVREGDKIYVGDFVLRIEASTNKTNPELAKPTSPDVEGAGPSSSPDEPKSLPDRKGEDDEPSERDADDVAAAGAVVPGPPRLPSTTVKPGSILSGPATISPVPVTTPTPPVHVATAARGNSSVPPQTNLTPTPPPPRGVRISSNPPDARDSSPALRSYRTMIASLIERASESFDFDQLSADEPLDAGVSARIASVIQELATQLKASGQLPDAMTIEQVVADARNEVVELGPLGPLGPLLVDEDVTEIHIENAERVLAFRKSRRAPTVILRATEKTIARALARLTKGGASTVLAQPSLERRIASGLHIIVASPAHSAKGSVVVLRKAQRGESATLDDLVRSGMLSRAMSTLLSHAVIGRANLLVAGPAGSGHAALMSALVNAAGVDERAIVLQDDDEIVFQHPNTLSMPLPADANEAIVVARSAARMRPDRLVFGSLAGLAAGVVTASGEGAGSVVAALRAPTLRQALVRLPADIVLARPGISTEAARECVGSMFDLALEVARLRDGRARVLRIAELRMEAGSLVARDVFGFNMDRAAATGAVEGNHHPTGIVPALVEDLASRGVALDAQIFRRNAGK